mgnify:CR=1 FL=1
MPILALLLACPAAAPQNPKEIAIDRDDIEIQESAVVKAGSYRVEDKNRNGVIRIVKSGITVDFRGAKIVGNAEGCSPTPSMGSESWWRIRAT